jgi:hypothetical protein
LVREQEAVMTVISLNIGTGHRFTGCHQRITYLDRPLWCEPPVGAEGQQ